MCTDLAREPLGSTLGTRWRRWYSGRSPMKSRSSLLAALGVFLLGGVVAMACTSPERAYGPDTLSTGSGFGGSSTGAMMSTGTGTTTMIPCAVPSDCPGKETECQTRICDGGMCGVSFSPAGVGIVAQNGGDCQKIVCDGKGDLTQQVDDTDVPVDSNPCTQDVCAAGVSSNPAVAFGTTCGGTLTCDNKGNCTGCSGPGECPGADTDCQTRSCTNGVCGFNYVASGTPVTAQTSGDCKKNVCDGAGNVTVALDGGDLASDANPCTTDVCSGGAPSYPPSPAGTACSSGGTVCNGSDSCGVCTPGDYQYCCGFKTSFCCEPIPVAPTAGLESRKGDDASDPGALDPLLPPGETCCCGGTIDCDATGHWSTCQN